MTDTPLHNSPDPPHLALPDDAGTLPIPASESLVPPPPAKPTPPSLLEIGQKRLTKLRTLLDAHRTSAADPEVDFVHDLRVLTRRLSEVVGILEGLVQPAVAEALTEVLRQTRKAAGDLRDLDVLAEHLTRWRMGPGLKPLRQRLLAEIPERRSALILPLRRQLSGATLSEALLVLARILENPAPRQAAGTPQLNQLLRKRLRRRDRQMRRAFGRAALKQTSTALHQARIAAKKYRYTLELAAESDVKKGGRTLQFLKKTQSYLGVMHDTDVILATLREHLADLSTPAPKTVTTEPEKPNPRLLAQAAKARRSQATAWRKFQKDMAQLQARRAAQFFASSYQWMNQKC